MAARPGAAVPADTEGLTERAAIAGTRRCGRRWFRMGNPSYKKPPASSATRPMALGNMRSLGPRALDVTCRTCGHHMTVNVGEWLDEVLLISSGPRMRCGKCGHLGASVR
jgi:hypothetical protein